MNKIDFFLAVSNGEIEDEKADQFIKEQTNSLDENRLERLYNEFRAFIFSDIHFMSYEGFEMPDFKAKHCEDFLSKIHSFLPNHELITRAERAKQKSIYKTLKKVNEGKYSELERIDLIERLTNNKLDKLKALRNDISEFLFHESKTYRENITKETLSELIKTYETNDLEPPLELRLFDVSEMKWRERTEDEKLDFESGKHRKEDYLDLEEAFYPDAFFHVNLLNFKVEQYIEKLEPTSKSKPELKNLQPIHWLNGEKSLRQFIDSLKSAGLIENRETDDIIQEHFIVDGKTPIKEPKPIVWIGTKVLLAHLINGIEKSVENKNIWKDLAPHFEWKGKIPDGLRQSAHNNSYPNNIEKIESIIEDLQNRK